MIGTNGAPVFSDASVTLVEETTATLSLDLANLADDPDAGEDGTTLTYSIVNAPTGGSVTLLGTILTFDPGTDFEDLASGESRAVTVDLRATDVDGETATATVTVTVTGANDGPEILATSQTGGSVTEPGAPSASNPVTASGQLFYSDPDEGTTSGTWTITPAGIALGAMTIDPASGQWTYSLDQAAADSLNAGEVRTETFTATVTDVFGADASEEVQITITGTNDAPLLQSDSRLIEGEQGSVTFDLEALASDIDSADLDGTLTFSILTGPAEGTATLDPAGRTLTYATGSDFDDLAEGQTATATITVQVSDSNGASTTADMTVTVTGTNDAPVITSNAAAAAGTVVEPGFEEPGTLSATGQLTYSDVDEGETSGTWFVTPAAPGSLGTIAIDPASGQWTYTLDPASADALDAGDSVTETFEAIYTDAFGAATAPQVLTITIEGTNDAPLMTAATLTVDEDTAGTIDLRTFTTDPDASDDPSNDITFGLSGPTEKGNASIVGGILSFDPDGDFDDLAVGDSEEVVLGITLSDPQGGTSTSTVTITVTGTNDGPVITSGPTDAAGTAIESGEGPATPAIVAADATGQLSYVDPDETPTTLGSWSVDAIGPSYGTMNIDSETGAWSYFLSPTLSDSLRQGETVEDRWTAVITDAEGAQAMEVITITITGTNDAPVIDDVTSLTDRGHTEGGPTTLTGQLVANDPDTFVDAPTWTITRADDIDVEEQTYGTMAINNDGLWTYTVDPEAVDTLGEGETAMETFRATVRDEFGQTDEVTVKVRFAGTNSAPELVVDISETDLNVSEAGDGREGSPVAVGQLSYFDNDEGETNGTWNITPTGETAYGSVSINPLTGQWRYELDQEKADSLTEGEQVAETFSATYTDAFGASTAALPLSITISGSNDAPTLTASDLAVSQGGSSSVDLSPLAADVDHALADLTFSISSPPAKGAATMTDGGELTFTTEGAFAGLGDGATEEVDISVVVADPDGATVTQTVTVTVTGTNDAPEIDSDAETFDVSDTLVETDSALTTSGEFDVTDIDEGDIVTVTGITLAATGVLNGAAANDDPTLLGYFSTSPGTVIDAETDSGPLSWTWNSGSEAFDYLATDETLVLTYNIALADDATPPGQVTQEVVITIEGTNDAPVITGSATAALTETADTTGDSATLTATDRLDFSDADLSDVDHTATVSGVTITGASGGLPGNAALLGLLSLTAAKSPSGTDGTIDWTFTAEDQTFDYLAKDETVTLSYEITLSDGNDGTDTTTVAVTVTGTNDAVTTSIGFPDAHRLYEYTDDNPLEGTLRTTSDEWYRASDDTWVEGVYDGGGFHVYDVDIADDVSFSVAPLGADYITDYQIHDFEQTTPTSWFLSWSYEVDDSALDFLTEGEVRTETFRVTLDDGNGGGTTRDSVIELVGTNDAPTLSTATLNADENSTDTTLDLTLLGDDVDSDDDGESLTYSIVSGPEEGTVSIEEGVLSFDANGDFEDLGEGETRTVTVDLLATDSHSATSEIVPFSIVVTGVNSAAVITGALSGVITEDEVPNTVGGDLDSVDPDTSDADDSWSAPATPISTTYGSATYDTSGNWVYTLDNGNASVNEMNVGGTLSDSFIATTIDGTEELVSITINGADDAAVISGTDTGTALEDDVAVTGDLNHTDVDNENDLWVAQSSTNTTYGTFDIATDGTWSYEVNNLNAAVDGLNIGDTLTDIVTVSTTGGTLKTIDLTIQGANDPAVISGDISGQVTEDSEIDSAFGQLAHQDPDDDDDLWQSVEVDGSDNGYGTYEITEGGSWTYRLDSSNPTVNALDENGTLTDTFTVTTTGGTDQQITIQISGSNDGPIAVSDTATVTLDKGTLDTTGWTQYGNHFYQFVPEEGGDGGPRFGWAEAQADAVAKGGHLATVTSSAEWAFLSGLHIGQAGWLGGSDEAVEGTWIWVAGPEAGQQFWQGGAGGNTVGGLYANWDAGQPDGATEDFLHAFGSGTWNDLADAGQENQIMGYYLEYSGPQATGNLSTNDTTGDGGTLTYSLLGYDEGEGEGETGEFEFDFGSSSSSTTTTYLLSDDSSGFTLFADGSWTFDLNSIDFDYLGEGSTTTTSTPYLVTDENGETDTATLTLEITGINNAAVIGGDIDGTISENDEGDTTTGTLTHTDVDQNNDNNLFQVVTDASDTASDQGYGTYSVDSSGYWIYTLDNTNEEIDGLTDGETRTDSFTVLTEDGTEQVVSILIEGQNDRPVTADQTIHVNLANGHFYQLIDVGYTWSQASADAALRGGHLATITSQQEMDFIADIQAGDLLAWLGGSDAAVEGTWRWVEGPEAGQIFWQGAADGSAPVGAYANWMNLQPTGPTLPDEDYAHTWIDEAWNDASAGNPRAYYLEYSDVSGMTVVGNASDVESSDLEFSLVGSYDGLTMQLDGSWALDQSHATYRALGEGQVQTVSATYQVVDEDGGTETAILELILTGVNDTPVAVQDTATTAEDTSVSIDVLDNDSDVDSGDMLVIASLSQPANGTAAVNGAGEVTYTPDRDFNGIDTFTYVASDGSGSTVTESVTVTVTPVDDPVIARADFASTDQDTAVVIDVIANDEDPEDATISVSSVGTAANGLVSLSAGVVTYTPDAEFFGIDTFTYQVTDSTAGNVTQTVTVVVNQDPEEFPIENPPTLSFNLTGGGGSPAGSVTIEVDPVASNGVNIAFGLDESGSITGGQFVTMIDSVKLAVANLVADFAGSSTSLDVHITPFDGDVDTSGPMQPQSFTVHTAAGVTNLTAFNSYMDAVKAAYNGGSTNWDAAFLDLKTFFDAQESTAPDDVNVAYFITDGNPNPSVTTPTWQTTTTALRAPPLDVDIKAFAIGSNVTTSNLSLIDPDFDAATQTLASANDLTAAFDASPLFNARLADFSLVLFRDGESVGEIADETIFTTPLTGIAFELPLADIQGLSGLLGDDNLFIATAKFDTDGNLGTTADVLQIVTQGSLSKATTSQNLTGTSESDLLLGGGLDDTLVGLDGNDVLMGFGGSDSILGGLGNDSITTSGTGAQMIDGGAGRDVLTFQTDADITSSVLTALNIQNFEALNITNNENNILTLTADRAAGLPSIAGDLLSVLGETGDTVVLEDSATRFFRTSSGGSITDSNGNVLDIYAIEDGSGAIISAVAVDQDTAVSFISDPAHTEGDGDLPFFYTEFDESEGGPVLEIGTEAGLGSGTATVDLSGIEALAPDILEDVAVIDMRNGQANELSIDAADLLNIIEGNDASENEYIWIQIDPEDTVNLVDDGGVPGSAGWDAESQAGNLNVYDISDTGGFGAYADTFATIFIDDGSAVA
ncbi:MAG: VCBS domain-containing protein [Sulfitobacter sp.]|nr:VCBS domain-containing protein [Sulfitobacter sp.]